MADTDKIFRDPLYNYIAIDKVEERWLLELIDTPEVQRLRRIHQLGVSHFTYLGADHSRLSHTLGVLHLMQQACRRVKSLDSSPRTRSAGDPLLAAAVLHDVGHGPFSHLFEPALQIDHERWSCEMVRSPDTAVHQTLVKHDIPVDQVIALIAKEDRQRPPWQKALLSSELDVDRLDYLRRDSYFTGSGYGHFDWYRILNSFTLQENDKGYEILVWPERAMYAIEEYIFSRFYMYNNVYQHKTTRGFEKLVHSLWRRAKQIQHDGGDPGFVPEIAGFTAAHQPSVEQYLRLDDATLLYQIQSWTRHGDRVLNDLARRFLGRNRFYAVDDPVTETAFADSRNQWEAALAAIVAAENLAPDYYVLRDDLKLTIYNPYMPEREEREQDPYNAIFVQAAKGSKPREISTVLERLAPVTGAREKWYRYYVPNECRDKVMGLVASRTW